MLTLDRRIFVHMDWRLVGLVVMVLAVGVTTIYSVTDQWSRGDTPLYLKQVAWALVGLAAFTAFALFDYHKLLSYGIYLWILALGMLLLVELLGRVGMGAQRWLDLGPVSVQPSELARLAVVLVLAHYLQDRIKPEGFRIHEILMPSLFAVLPFALILGQPDLGSALMVMFVCAVMLLFAGIHQRLMVTSAVLVGMALPFAWEWFWNSLHAYQQRRILTFLNPGSDPLGSGYHVTQSKIAIGAGGLGGQGFLQGSQSQLKFLPEGHTDFIFSVFAEQWGFLGVLVLLILFGLLLARGLTIALKARDTGGTLVAAGLTSMIAFYVFVNLGMTLGVAPVVGVPLPLMSYGGTSLVTTMSALGILANVHLQRHLRLYR